MNGLVSQMTCVVVLTSYGRGKMKLFGIERQE